MSAYTPHTINTLSQHTTFAYSFNPPFQHTISTLPINLSSNPPTHPPSTSFADPHVGRGGRGGDPASTRPQRRRHRPGRQRRLFLHRLLLPRLHPQGRVRKSSSFLPSFLIHSSIPSNASSHIPPNIPTNMPSNIPSHMLSHVCTL